MGLGTLLVDLEEVSTSNKHFYWSAGNSFRELNSH